MAYIGSNVKVEVEQTLATAVTITGITKANPGVVTAASHGYANGDVVKLTVSAGMVELDGQIARVANSTASTFELEGIDTTNYSTFTAGTAKKITAWQTLSNAQNISMPDPAPAKIDITTLIDKAKQYTYGLPDAPDGSIAGLFDPNNTAVGLIRAATKSNAALGFRVTFSGGQKTLFNAQVSGGQGFDLQANAAASSTIAFTPVKDVLHFAS